MDSLTIDICVSIFTGLFIGLFFNSFITNFFVFWKLDEMQQQIKYNNQRIKDDLDYIYVTLTEYLDNQDNYEDDYSENDDYGDKPKNFTDSETEKNSDAEVYNSDFENNIEEDDIIENLEDTECDVNHDNTDYF